MTIPYRNATLTAITAVGLTRDYDSADTDGTTRWTGNAGIYVHQQAIETLSPGRVDEVIQTRLELPYKVGKYVERGDTLTYTFEDDSLERKAGTILRARLVGRVQVLLENA